MTLRYKLRTLLILLAILPPLLWVGWTKYEAWKAERERLKALQQLNVRVILTTSVAPTTSFIPQPAPPGSFGTGSEPVTAPDMP